MARKRAHGATDRAGMAEWLFNNSRDLMQVVGPDGVLLQVNLAWSEWTGLSEADLIGRSVFDFCHPDEVPGIQGRADVAQPGDVSEAEVRLRHRDGSWRWVAARRQVMDSGAHIGNMRDISAERAYRDEIEDARRTRKLLGAQAGIGMWTYEPVKGAIDWSEELTNMLGLQPGQITKPSDFNGLLHPRERQRVSDRFMASVRSGESAQFEHRIRAHDDWKVVRATIRTEPRDGGVHALIGISEDVTELARTRDAARKGEQQTRRAQREIQATASRLNLALEAAEAGVYEIDHVRKTFWCSPEFERVTGRTNSSYAEASELRYPGFHIDDLPHVRAAFRALHRGEKRSGEFFEARIVRPDGVERWVRVYHHLQIARNGRWQRAIGLIQDCDTGKRQELALIEAQRAAQAGAEAKAAFLANMSHEIRTPMNGVMGVLHLLKTEKHLSEDGRGLLREALSCGQMLAELLNDVIDFSKIEAGRLELACEPVDPADLVGGVVRLLEPQAREKGLQLIIDADPALGWVRSDPVRLRQALFNLVGNAVKFTEKGHVVVRCRRAGDSSERGGMLRFEVEDTGIGIAPDAQSRLFQRFNQADASTTRRFGGSGLGLAITGKLAEMMNGQVGFSSAEGQGSTFWFEVRAETAEAQVEVVESTLSVLDGVRILVVEDNATNRLIATKLLENMGASVETANDGYDGVNAAARGGFDLILMDIQMPGIDGVEAARRIRALGGTAAAIPIVALTANVLAHQRQAYLDAGMDGVVGKPISPANLLSEIAGAVANRESAGGGEIAIG